MEKPQPFVIAYHLIWTAYGWWLPNDPRGSMSRTVETDVIAELGELHYGRKRVQPPSREIHAFYCQAAALLKHPLQALGGRERAAAAEAFADAVTEHRYTCYACAIMSEHVHFVIRKHRHQAEEMIATLQAATRSRLRSLGFRGPDHPAWGGPGWKVFLDCPEDIERTIGYVRQNPITHRLGVQDWAFVKPYDGWPLHPGHNPNSPYARRLRGRRRGG